VNAVVIGRDFAAQMRAAFELDQAASQAVEPAAWAARPGALRLQEWVARWWERLL
jgi:cardiolipin synthase